MKFYLLTITICLLSVFVRGQITSSTIEVVTVYSQNQKFFLKTVPYDDESPTLRGKTSVFRVGIQKPLYEFERGFDFLDYANNFVFLSQDGEIVFSVIGFDANEEIEGLRSITIYKRGKIVKSFTAIEITGCKLEKERCNLIYNGDSLIEKQKVMSKTEMFLDDFACFFSDDTVYLTDSKKNTHIFDFNDVSVFKTDSFDNLFESLRQKAKTTKRLEKSYPSPSFVNFPKLKASKNTTESLADFVGMKPYYLYKETDKQFRGYSFEISVNILRDGSLEIESDDINEDLPREKILEFFKTNKFDTSKIPSVFPKWHVGEKVFFLRKANDDVSREERKIQIVEEREKYSQRLIAESLDGVIIPKNLVECFIELDKILSEVDKNEFKALPKRDDMIKYHFGLGMWMRNNWGLWGGSRLQKYFSDRKISHPDDMSAVILFYYHDWLNGRKETWKDWEKNPK